MTGFAHCIASTAMSPESSCQGTKGTAAVGALGANVSYTPNLNANGADSFTYTISDGNGGTDTATVRITVKPVNDTPVAEDDAAVTEEDTAVDIAVLANDTDVDGDTLSIATVSQPQHGVVGINPDETLRYAPAAVRCKVQLAFPSISYWLCKR